MNFEDVRSSLRSLATRLEADCGRPLFDEITVDEPSDEISEMGFFKLVNWSYVLLNEAGQIPLKFVISLVRVSNADVFASITEARQAVQNLRTAAVHNLPQGDAANRHKARQAKMWLDQHGGEPCDWAQCCGKLATQVAGMLQSCAAAWAAATAEPSDKAQNVSRLLATLDSSWEPHEFDLMVSAAASELGISGLNVVNFRQSRLEDWRKLTSYFEDRDTAEQWVRVAIRKELASLFAEI